MAGADTTLHLLDLANDACIKAGFKCYLEAVDLRLGKAVGAIQLLKIIPRDEWYGGRYPTNTPFKVNMRFGPSNKILPAHEQPILVRCGSGWESGDVYFNKLAKAQLLREPEIVREWKAKLAEDLEAKRIAAARKFAKFWDFPAEIRRMVYRSLPEGSYVYPYKCNTDNMWICARPGSCAGSFEQTSAQTSSLALMATDRRMRYEAAECLYREATFCFQELSHFTKFFAVVDPYYTSLIRKLVLNFGHFEFLRYFRANIPSMTTEGSRHTGLLRLKEVPLDELIIEFPPRGMYGHSYANPFTNPCAYKLCAWIIKAVKTYLKGTAIKKVKFVGGDHLDMEWEGLQEVEEDYDTISYEDIAGGPVQAYP
ncbi:hypothetical protein MMC06_001373, partial [Schaereria dolodes]|nr:hypothetical protein [Schaereria dolodes]